MLVKERTKDIGNFLVGRLLPFRKKRQVGPFTFIDHMGPGEIGPGQYMDVDQHPHIGLSTLTYLLEGQITHRDSTGAVQTVSPGDVGFMTSGAGVAHTERTPEQLRDGQKHAVHGYQVWVALPVEKENMSPHFQYIPSHSLPTTTVDGLNIKLIAGQGFGLTSPLEVYSPLFMVEAYAPDAGQLAIDGQVNGEIAIVVVKGAVSDEDTTITSGQMLISKTQGQCHLKLEKDTRILLFGGEPLPEERFLYWNFVASDKALLEKAKEEWAAKKFPTVPGDHTYIPLP